MQHMVMPIFRLTLWAVLLLVPSSIAAALVPATSFIPVTSMPSGHCNEDQEPADAPSAPKAHCAACAALPAGDAPVAVAELRPALLLEVEAERWIAAREPDIDTPPPKLG